MRRLVVNFASDKLSIKRSHYYSFSPRRLYFIFRIRWQRVKNLRKHMNITTVLRIDWARIYSVSHKISNNANECEMLILLIPTEYRGTSRIRMRDMCLDGAMHNKMNVPDDWRIGSSVANFFAPIFSLVNRSALGLWFIHCMRARHLNECDHSRGCVSYASMTSWRRFGNIIRFTIFFLPPFSSHFQSLATCFVRDK